MKRLRNWLGRFFRRPAQSPAVVEPPAHQGTLPPEPEWMCEWGWAYEYVKQPTGRTIDQYNARPPHPITNGVKAARYFHTVFGTREQRDLAIRFMNSRVMRGEPRKDFQWNPQSGN